MNPAAGGSPRTRGELRFHLFGISVTVQPWFWLTIVMMSGTQSSGAALVWVGVCFVSILVHELGHIFAFRSFGEDAEAVLYAWGGLSIPHRNIRMSAFQRVLISLAGPAAGFALAIVVVAIASLYGARIHLDFHAIVPTLHASILPEIPDPASATTYFYWNLILNDLLYVNIFWGLVNLLPIYPLDGGQVARALFARKDLVRGVRRSLILSVATAVMLAAVGLLTRSLYLVFLFGILAVSSVQALQAHRSLFRTDVGPT